MRIALTALFAIASIALVKPSTPALTKKVVHNNVTKQPAVSAKPIPVTPVTLVQPQPEIKTAAATPYAGGCETYRSIFALYWSGYNLDTALAICQAESGGDPYAVSSTNDYGLMQLHDEEIFNPSANIAGAYQKYLSQGWYAWTTYNTGRYQMFL